MPLHNSSTLIEIITEKGFSRHYYRLASQLNFNYKYISLEGISKSSRNIQIPIQEVIDTLNILLN